MTRKTDAGADYTGVVFSGGDVCRKKRKGRNDSPHPIPRATSGPYPADPNNEVWGWGSIQVRLARRCAETPIATPLQ